jgi:hypothetical protein
MKNSSLTRKVVAAVTAVLGVGGVSALVLPGTAMAADTGTASITITNTTVGHTYKALKVGSYANPTTNTDGSLKSVEVNTVDTIKTPAATALGTVDSSYTDTQYSDNPHRIRRMETSR